MNESKQTTDVPCTFTPIKPKEEPCCREEDVELLKAFLDVPTASKAWAFPCREGVHVALQMSQKNLPGNSQRKWMTQFQLTEAVLEAGEAEIGLPVELSGATMVAPSPSGKKLVIAKSGKDDKNAATLEVWNRGKLMMEIDVSSEMHGAIYNDGWFGCGATWSPTEKEIAYVAESPIQSRTPKWHAVGPNPAGSKEKNDSNSDAGASARSWRGVGEFREDWGELNTGKRPPAIYTLNIETGQVSEVQGIPDGASCGQPQWSTSGDSLVFVAWTHDSENFPEIARRLGIVYCFNRPCALYGISWPQPQTRDPDFHAYRITPPTLASAFSPRFSPNGKSLIFLSQHQAVSTGVHNGTPALMEISWTKVSEILQVYDHNSKNMAIQPRVIVDVVESPKTIHEFPGLYCNLLPDFPFICDGSMVLATVQWRSESAIVGIKLSDGEIFRLSPANGSSWTLLVAANNWLVASETRPNQPPNMLCCHISDRDQLKPQYWSWSRIILPDFNILPEILDETLQNIVSEILQITPRTKNGPSQTSFEAVVIHRKDVTSPLPGIIFPHGGPHTCYSSVFAMPTFLAACGYCVILVNYRGSTGFGEKLLQSLPGNIGVNDVEDCIAALDLAIEKGYVDESRVAALGGSHGGFLSAHLVGQYPDRFQAAVLRNPVCNISLMVRCLVNNPNVNAIIWIFLVLYEAYLILLFCKITILQVHLSDIPDWCFIEAWGTEEGRKRASSRPLPSDLELFTRISPFYHIEKVKASVLMMLGACDRRVPLDDGKRYLDALKRREDAPDTHLIVFPEDTHALDRPQTEFEQWITALWWLRKHVKS